MGKQTVTPSQLASKFAKVARAVKEQDAVAIAARAAVTKKVIVAAAESSSNLGRRYGKRFVRYRLKDDTAFVRLWSGFGALAELGSYKASASGWDEEPKNGAQALAVGEYGFFARVDHPPIKAHPFWNAGVAAARAPGKKAWDDSVRNTISKALH